jgi:hypothetical protein
MSGVTVSLSKGLIRMNAEQCAVDRSCRGAGDEVDVGGGRRAGVPVSKRKDGKVREEVMMATVLRRPLEIEVAAPHRGPAVDAAVPGGPTVIRHHCMI